MGRRKTRKDIVVQNCDTNEMLKGHKYKTFYNNEVIYFKKLKEVREYFSELGVNINLIRPNTDKRKRTKPHTKPEETPVKREKTHRKQGQIVKIHGIEFIYDEEDDRYYDKNHYDKGIKEVNPFDK